MNDRDCTAFLQWALPRLQLRWAGFRKVRKQVCKRVARRLRGLGLSGPDAYRRYLQQHPDEWHRLDSCCRISLSRFYRDRGVFEALGSPVLPALAQQAAQRPDSQLSVWCAGCAAGEEPYSLLLLWQQRLVSRWPGVALSILATDADPNSLERARRACYPPSSLKELPARWRAVAFERVDTDYCLRPGCRAGVRFQRQDLRRQMPAQHFDLILCRNLAFTYFSEALQRRLLNELRQRLRAGGALVIGAHESLPGTPEGLAPWPGAAGVFSARQANADAD